MQAYGFKTLCRKTDCRHSVLKPYAKRTYAGIGFKTLNKTSVFGINSIGLGEPYAALNKNPMLDFHNPMQNQFRLYIVTFRVISSSRQAPNGLQK